MHFHGWNYIKNACGAASAIYPSPSLSLAPTRKRREAMSLDNAQEFHSKFTVAVPEVSGKVEAALLHRVCEPSQLPPSQLFYRIALTRVQVPVPLALPLLW